ncbi:MAG: hypothetical protein KIT45_14080 [Fimbriimonadia bacterium]|nr:hypothetical protein [Fimbriimonadia bacterium]
MKTKAFDCVEMKRAGAAYVQELIANMTPEEQREFWKEGHLELLKKQAELKEKHNAQEAEQPALG